MPSGNNDVPAGVTFTPVQPQSTDNAPAGVTFTPVGGGMPADVAARHAKTREGTANAGMTHAEYEMNQNVGEGGIKGLLSGVGKSGIETLQGGTRLVNKLLPSGAQIPIPASTADTDVHGFAEGAGSFLENTAEFLSGDEILKGLTKISKLETLAKSSPAVSKLIKSTPNLLQKVLAGGAKAGLVGGVQGGVKGAAHGQALEGAEGGAAGGAMGGSLGELVGPGLGVVKRILKFGDPESALFKAGRPNVKEAKYFKDALEVAAPRIVKAAETTPLKKVGDLEDLFHNAAQDLRQREFGPMIQRNANQMMSAYPVRQKILDAITKQMKEYAPEEAKELSDFAVSFAKDMSLGKAEQDLQYFNASLKKFYQTNAVDQAAALKTSGTVAKFEAAADGLRDLIYTRLKELEPNNPPPELLQKQYGALKDLERVFAKRATVADRQNPINLAQMLTWAGSGAAFMHSLVGGNPWEAAVAAAPVVINTVAKKINSPEFLMREGVRQLAGKPTIPQVITRPLKQLFTATGALGGREMATKPEQP